MKTRLDALQEIIWDARAERSSAASYKRVAKALTFFEFTADEVGKILYTLGYADAQANVYEWALGKKK